jgi:hypothetical protein
MWWNPAGTDEPNTYATVLRLNDLFLTPSRTIQAVHGVGSTVDEHRRRVPLLVLDSSYAPALGVHERLSEFWRAYFSRGLDPPFVQRARLHTPFRDADSRIRLLLERWDVPEETQLMFSVPPPPLARPGNMIWGSNKKTATLGFFLQIPKENRIVCSTAGHLVTTLPCDISMHHRRWFGLLSDRIERIGEVTFSNDPTSSAGVDIAIADLSGLDLQLPHVHAEVADAAVLPDLVRTTLFGGKSRKQIGWVDGALQSTRALDGRIWRNCWTVIEVNRGFAQRGDSGGPVVFRHYPFPIPTVLGHLVTALGLVRPTGRYQCGLVQDIRTTLDFLEMQYGHPVSVLSEPDWFFTDLS